MQINRQSYEEIFLLYADGELNEGEKKAVEDFVDQNPDLEGEFSLIQDTVLQPDESIIFENKELLFRNEEEDRKVIYLRWFRIAAAASVLVAFSVIGWLYMGTKNVQHEPVAVVQKPQIKKTDNNAPVVTEKNNTAVPAEKSSIAKTAIPVTKKQNNKPVPQKEKKEINTIETTNDPDVATKETPDNIPEIAVPEHTALTQDVVKSDPATETIDVPVEPRAMGSDEPQPARVEYAQSYKQEPDNDMIYFANTSLSKKTKLRGVLRKATRYLDRVTSLQ